MQNAGLVGGNGSKSAKRNGKEGKADGTRKHSVAMDGDRNAHEKTTTPLDAAP
ncbi:MAG TPA: hypothetical protein VEN30_29040 [Paraburkholderia sp.]|nr:hypothetical protein [Paraburkholderia sp.]